MTAAAEARLLPDGKRLHLHHGPIDLIVGVEGPHRNACFARATTCFQTILTGLVAELDTLRAPVGQETRVKGPIARRMVHAVRPYEDVFCTPMAAVAGAVADEVLAAMLVDRPPVTKAYVNNGGDVAFHLAGSERMTSLSPAGDITLSAHDTARGLATSGWQGRSHSMGIADAVTVAGRTAAQADVAATLIANAVSLGAHPSVQTCRADALSPDSDLGPRHVTTQVGPLREAEIDRALRAGAGFAQTLCARGLICQASLLLQGKTLLVTPQPLVHRKSIHA